MNWKEVLKMPMPMNVGQQRDERFKQRIVDYEEDIIEPKLTEHFEKQKAGTKQRFAIKAVEADDINRTDRFFPNEAQPMYVIGSDAVKMMGSNTEYIVKVIGELYDKEGYQVKRLKENIIIIQPENDGTI